MARSGFLTLHDCGNPAAQSCAKCGRMMCMQHLSPASGFTECVECATFSDDMSPDDPAWAYGYRRNYYKNSGYSPFYDGESEFDDFDVRSFDDDANDNAASVAEGQEGEAGFGDS